MSSQRSCGRDGYLLFNFAMLIFAATTAGVSYTAMNKDCPQISQSVRQHINSQAETEIDFKLNIAFGLGICVGVTALFAMVGVLLHSSFMLKLTSIVLLLVSLGLLGSAISLYGNVSSVDNYVEKHIDQIKEKYNCETLQECKENVQADLKHRFGSSAKPLMCIMVAIVVVDGVYGFFLGRSFSKVARSHRSHSSYIV